jgi:hypothetical protein
MNNRNTLTANSKNHSKRPHISNNDFKPKSNNRFGSYCVHALKNVFDGGPHCSKQMSGECRFNHNVTPDYDMHKYDTTHQQKIFYRDN